MDQLSDIIKSRRSIRKYIPDINRTLGAPESWRLMSVIPVGKPAFVPQTKKMKNIEDVMDIR